MNKFLLMIRVLLIAGIFSACSQEEELQYPPTTFDFSKCPSNKPQLPIFEGFKQETGYVEVERGGIFYWLARARKTPDTAPVVLRLHGGPGGATQGPIGVNEDLTVFVKKLLDGKANVIYVDQPVGVGFSYVNDENSYADNREKVTQDMLHVIRELLTERYPEFRGRELYVYGESFAGIYIPWLAKAIIQNNLKERAAGRLENIINLKGIAIISGEMDRLASYKNIPLFALERKLIDKDEYSYLMDQLVPACEEALQEIRTRGKSVTVGDSGLMACEPILRYLDKKNTFLDEKNIGRMGYGWHNADVDCYFNNPAVKSFLKVKDKVWDSPNWLVYNQLMPEGAFSVTGELQFILNHEVEVTILHGDMDLMLPYQGAEEVLDQLALGKYGDWPGREQYQSTFYKELYIDGRQVGKQRVAGPLKYFLFYNAGHGSVPAYFPEANNWFLEGFINR